MRARTPRRRPGPRLIAAGLLLVLAGSACGLNDAVQQTSYGERIPKTTTSLPGSGGTDAGESLGTTQSARAPKLTPPVATATGIDMRWPVGGESAITSPFGWRIDPIEKTRRFHHGLDIGCWRGQQIDATATGRVMFAGEARIYGNAVVIAHNPTVWTIYGHLDRVGAKVGEHVKAGEPIGRCGSTGRSTGPHLHLEVRYGNTVVDPLTFLG